MDIIVGNMFYYNAQVAGVSHVALYRNIGTRTNPKFEEVTTDYMNLSQFNLLNINPAFGDMDGDGKQDMIIGDATGNISYFKNMGDTVASFPAMTNSSYFNINVDANAAPFIYDVNNDGLPDLVIGNMYGRIAYYWNFGTPTSPQFSVDSVDSAFGNIDVTLPNASEGNSQPYIMRDSAGNMLLFVGTDQGVVYEYLIDTNHLRGGTFTRLDSNFLQHTVGSQATMQAYDLNGDGKPEYITGCSRGGLQLFSETVWDSSVILKPGYTPPFTSSMKVYPNPADAQFTCITNDSTGATLQPQVYNVLGQKINVPYTINQNIIQFNTAALAAGMYVVRVIWGNQIYSARVIVQHHL